MKQVTMKDIAAMAGVTRQTVSKIINKKDPDIGKETREKVLGLVKKLGYRKNFFSQSLKKGKTNLIGMMRSVGTILPFNHAYFSHPAAGVAEELERQNSKYSLMVFGSNFGTVRDESGDLAKSMDLVLRGIVDGLILVGVAHEMEKFEKTILPVLRENQIPFVTVFPINKKTDYNLIGTDSGSIGTQLIEHLIGLGRKTFGVFSYSVASWDRSELISRTPFDTEVNEAILQGIKKAGLPADALRTIELGEKYTPNSIYREMVDFSAKLKDPPEALICPGGTMWAMGVIEGLRRNGYRVPEDVSVVNYGMDLHYQQVHPVTNVPAPARERGIEAVNLLQDILEGKKSPDKVYRTYLKTTLDVRESCGGKKS